MTDNIPTVVLKKSLITSKEATDLNMAIQALIATITTAVFDFGALLRKMRDTRGYISLGYKTFEEWKNELRIKRQTIYNYLKLDECWRERLSHIVDLDKKILLNTPYSNILCIAHIILDKNDDGTWKHTDDSVVEWVHKCHVLSRSDLHIELEENHPFPRPLVLHWRGKFHKIVELNQGQILTISQFTVQYGVRMQDYWKIFGNRKVKGTLQLDEEE